MTFRHDEHFLDEVVSFLQSQDIQPDWMENYHFAVSSPAYLPLLDFVQEELERLPFHNEVGRTYLVRDDAESVVQRLGSYLEWQAKHVKEKQFWHPDAESIADLYQGWGEVFKNKIFSGMNLRAICYSLDLATGPRAFPMGFRLMRYLVDGRKDNPDSLTVLAHGALEVLFPSGLIKLDLAVYPANVHDEE